MVFKIVTLFLVVMGVLAMFGKLKAVNPRRLLTGKCGGCGRYRIGKGPCACGRSKG